MAESDIVIRWLMTTLVLGWLAAPIARLLTPMLPLAGFFLARPLGILLVAYGGWLAASLRLTTFQTGVWSVGLALGVALMFISFAVALRAGHGPATWRPARATLVGVGLHEVAYCAVFLGFAWLRGFTPDITFTEKPMELMLLNSALHAQSMPPADGWFAGQTVNYYYLGYVLAAALTTLTGAPIGYAFNLMLTTIVALSAATIFGLTASVWAMRGDAARPALDWGSYAVGAVAAYLLIAAGNLVGGLRWLGDAAGTATASWWGGIGWASSRVIVDHIGAGERQTINEFPWFSFILGDLHPHVLALPWVLLALGIVVDWWRWSPVVGLVKREALALARLALGALAVGVLYAINSWDFPIYLALALVALMRPSWWVWVRPPTTPTSDPTEDQGATDVPPAPEPSAEDRVAPEAAVLPWRPALLATALLVGASVLLFLPFYLSFTSFAGAPGIRPLGGLERLPVVSGLLRTVGIVMWERTNFGEYLQVWGCLNALALAWLLRLAARGLSIPSNIAGLALVGVALAGVLLGSAPLALTGATAALALIVCRFGRLGTTEVFTCVLVIVAAGLIVGPEFVFLQDVFSDRMNTIFKAYYQAWVLLSVVGGLGVGATVAALRQLRNPAWTPGRRIGVVAGSAMVALLLLLTLGYPLMATAARAERFAKRTGLDGLAYAREQPDEYAGLAWLAANVSPSAVVAEDPGHSYGEHYGLPHARASAVAGTRTPIAWPGHQSQWRANQPALLTEMNNRLRDTQELFATTDTATAQRILDRYGIDYVYVGLWERAAENRQRARQPVYSPQALAKFEQFMDVAFQQGQVTVFKRR